MDNRNICYLLLFKRVVCEWLKFLGATEHPLLRMSLHTKVFELSPRLQEHARISGIKKGPGRNWVNAFIARHPDIWLNWPTGLDPKHASMFNLTIVNHHFTLLSNFLVENKIPWENIYNMDEKAFSSVVDKSVIAQNTFTHICKRCAFTLQMQILN